jgi:hypothetical protein
VSLVEGVMVGESTGVSINGCVGVMVGIGVSGEMAACVAVLLGIIRIGVSVISAGKVAPPESAVAVNSAAETYAPVQPARLVTKVKTR